MPLKLNIGLSRKVGEANYGSRGASVNVEVEVDSSLVTEPGKLQERIRQLFGLVRTSLAEELNGNGNGHPSTPSNSASQQTNGTAANASTGNAPRSRKATQSQGKAIFAICRNRGLDMKRLLQERFKVSNTSELTIEQASKFIDELKNSPEGGG